MNFKTFPAMKFNELIKKKINFTLYLEPPYLLYALPYLTIPHHALQCFTKSPLPNHTPSCLIMPYSALPIITIPYYTVSSHYPSLPCSTMPYHTLRCLIMLFHTIPSQTMPNNLFYYATPPRPEGPRRCR